MRTTFIIFLCIVSFKPAKAQSLQEEFLSSFQTEPRPVFALGTRNAFVTNDFAKMRHVFVGLNYQNVTRVGVSFNWLTKGFRDNSYTPYPDNLRMLYIAPHIEYVFFRTQHWELNIPVQLGLGMSYLYSIEIDNNNQPKNVRSDKGFIALYEPAMTAQYRFLKYFAVGAGAGFRLMLRNNPKLNENFNSLVYMAWFKVFFGDLYKEYVKKG